MYIVFIDYIVDIMYVDVLKTKGTNGRTYKRALLRDSYRENGKVKHHTIANLSSCSDQEIEAIQKELVNKPVTDLVHLPVMQNPDIKICMKLLMTMWAPNFISGDIPMTMLIAACMVRLSLEYGNAEESAYGYVTHGINIAARTEVILRAATAQPIPRSNTGQRSIVSSIRVIAFHNLFIPVMRPTGHATRLKYKIYLG